MKDFREAMIGETFHHNGENVEVTQLDADENLVIVTNDFTGFYRVRVSELVKLTKDDNPFCLDELAEGQSITFISNETTYAYTWDDKLTNHTLLTKDKIYHGVAKKDELGIMFIEFIDDQDNTHHMTYDYAVGKIDFLEEM